MSGTARCANDRDQIDPLLEALSPEERYVVLSAKLEGTGYPELAEHLGKSVDAVKKMASSAIQPLRATAPDALHEAPAS